MRASAETKKKLLHNIFPSCLQGSDSEATIDMHTTNEMKKIGKLEGKFKLCEQNTPLYRAYWPTYHINS